MRRLQVKLQRFLQVGQSLFFRFALARDVHFEALRNEPLPLAPDRRGERTLQINSLSHQEGLHARALSVGHRAVCIRPPNLRPLLKRSRLLCGREGSIELDANCSRILTKSRDHAWYLFVMNLVAQKARQREQGPRVYENWRAFLDSEPLQGEFEFLMYSDAWLTGELTTGLDPYQFFNLVGLDTKLGKVRASVAVRVSDHLEYQVPNMTKKDVTRYHGGWIADELAALASLATGVRFRAGGETRRFDLKGDRKGRPMGLDFQPKPELSIGFDGFVLPAVTGPHSLMPIAQLKGFPKIPAKYAVVLMRSARLYQDALWLAESEPSFSWLMLVSAVETAANSWRSSSGAPLERLRESKPSLVEYLEQTGVEKLAARVAQEFADSLGATKTFVEFLLAYLPSPPKVRPGDWGQVEWNKHTLKKFFRQVYSYRSEALHDGQPFPAPMCEIPYRHETWAAVAEKPTGLATSYRGGTWRAQDTPMLLNTFEYIARQVLNSWWSSMVSDESGSTA